MSSTAVAIDLGTSGFRGQSIDLITGEITSTVVTLQHPVPGANVIDHIHFALNYGIEKTNFLMIGVVNRIINELSVKKDDIVRLAVCGNPAQLSIFLKDEIRDLAFSGKNKLIDLGVEPPERKAVVKRANEIEGLDLPAACEVIIPPAVRLEIGADALAMLIVSGLLERDETAIITDYGTNAEMAVYKDGKVITGSTAAGPAIEGLHISYGILAAPGAISDMKYCDGVFEELVLNKEMKAEKGPSVDPYNGEVIDGEEQYLKGITGTGTVSLISESVKNDLISIPNINSDSKLIELGNDISFNESDLKEVGKAIGAIRAGHQTLCHYAGIAPDEIERVYLSGASGTYVDAEKARLIGMVPANTENIVQIGNTSLAMAVRLALDPANLEKMSILAKQIRNDHCCLAESDLFKKLYILELSYWTEGMPLEMYNRFLKKYGLEGIVTKDVNCRIEKRVKSDIADVGINGLTVLSDIGRKKYIEIEDCNMCRKCMQVCPGDALTVFEKEGRICMDLDMALCFGLACRKCEQVCSKKVIDLDHVFAE